MNLDTIRAELVCARRNEEAKLSSLGEATERTLVTGVKIDLSPCDLPVPRFQLLAPEPPRNLAGTAHNDDGNFFSIFRANRVNSDDLSPWVPCNDAANQRSVVLLFKTSDAIIVGYYLIRILPARAIVQIHQTVSFVNRRKGAHRRARHGLAIFINQSNCQHLRTAIR